MELAMYGKRTFPLLALCWVLLGSWSAAEAAPPWGSLFSTSRVDSDATKEYALTDQNGPWMIMTCSFSWERAREQAKDLALELRQRYQLEDYVHKAHFDFEDIQGRGLTRYGTPVKMKLLKDKPELEEYAVLVGNYTTLEDPEAQRTLQKMKYAQPKCLELREDKPTAQSLAGWRMLQKQLQTAIQSEKAKKGPMGHAFVTTNPRLPKEFFVPTGIDKVVLRMNKGVDHSLLDCPGKYTVLVATFKGHEASTQKEIRAVENGEHELGADLAAAADKAHTLTTALRQKGYEAYEFHDHFASIVTVGSFESVGTPRPDGKIEINPAVHKVIETFKPEPISSPGAPPGTMKWKGVVGIPFDIQPIPVQVPKRSIVGAYSQN
jgi:hypothetical protein